jgi:glucose-6-phosphate isomerase
LSAGLGINLDTFVAPAPRAVTRAQALALASRLKAVHQRLHGWRDGGEPSFFMLPFRDDPGLIATLGGELAARFRRTIVFGIGGSSLGGEMLVRILGRNTHAVQFFDNIDPTTLAALDTVDWRETQVLVISKSGNTAETLAQLLTVLPALQAQLGPTQLREHLRVITENPASALGSLAHALHVEILPHPPVGGRFSVLSIVGLLPAALAGVDIAALMAGARSMAEKCLDREAQFNPAFLGGSLQYLHASHGRTLCAQIYYSDTLRPLARWYQQLWSESLGKRDGAGQAHGLTPLAAFGATDQHSQLQLYLDGPDDKQYTFIESPSLRAQGARMAAPAVSHPLLTMLAGHTTGELFLAECEATRTTLTRRARPLRTLTLDPDDAFALGELIVLLEVETVVVAELLGVNPFDQPAVEEGKDIARRLLARA